MVERRGGGGGLVHRLPRRNGLMTGGTRWKLGRRRSQKAASPRVEYRLSRVSLPIGTCRAATFPGRETHGDGLDHPLEVSRERVKVDKQRGVDRLLHGSKSVVDAVTQPCMGTRSVPPPGNSAELVVEETKGCRSPVDGGGTRGRGWTCRCRGCWDAVWRRWWCRWAGRGRVADPRGAPSKLVGRGGLLGQVALVASATLGQSVAAQAPSQSGWFRSAWRRGPEMGRCGVQNVHGEGYALYQPSAFGGVRMAERVM